MNKKINQIKRLADTLPLQVAIDALYGIYQLKQGEKRVLKALEAK